MLVVLVERSYWGAVSACGQSEMVAGNLFGTRDLCSLNRTSGK